MVCPRNLSDHMLGLFYFQQETNQGTPGPDGILGEDTIIVGSQVLSPALAFLSAVGDWSDTDSLFETETLALFARSN